MGYLSFDASIKIHRSGVYTSTKTDKKGYGGISGYIHHIDRATDRKNGCEVNHSNLDIHSDFTLENQSYYKDFNGIWQQTNTSNDMLNSVNRRIVCCSSKRAFLLLGVPPLVSIWADCCISPSSSGPVLSRSL